MQSCANIGAKKMGELDTMPFQAAAEKKLRGSKIKDKAIEWCLLWEQYLRDPRWHPFKVVRVGGIYEVCLGDFLFSKSQCFFVLAMFDSQTRSSGVLCIAARLRDCFFQNAYAFFDIYIDILM